MPQLFRPSANLWARCLPVAGFLAALGAIGVGYLLQAGPGYTRQDEVIEQPIAFSHEHHVGGLGISCVYCHNSVEESAYAGMPPTSTCMTCHSQVWTDSTMLEPVRESWLKNEPIQWNRVHDVPDYAYFNHSIHVAKGVGCSTCHGEVDTMPLMRKVSSLTMGWCLDCHRDPSEHQRPHDEIFEMEDTSPGGAAGVELSKAYGTYDRIEQLQNCSVCHR